MYSITLLSILCLVSAVITYGLGIFVFAKNPVSRTNKIFLLVNLGASYWAIGEYLIWSQNSYENVWFWLKMSSFWTVVIVMCVHFILTYADHPYSKPENRIFLIAILYIPAIILAALNICTESIFTVAYESSRYFYAPALGNPVYQISTVYFLAVLLWGVYVGFQTRKTAGNDRYKKQSGSISIGLIILIGFGSQSVIILPYFGVYEPNLVFIGILLFSIAITYAILKYGLLILSPETVATNIIRIMPDGLILTDMNGEVISSNASAGRLLSTNWRSNPP